MTKFNKRWISILAVLALVTTMFCGISIQAEGTDEAETVKLVSQTEEDFLLHLGILKTPGPVQEAETTRGGFAQIASRVANLPEYTGSDVYFYDVPTTHKYYKEINALAMAGILKGDGDGGFRPDDPVSPEELSTVCSIILGYRVIGEDETYRVVANRIGLLDGLELSGNVTVGQMLKMVLNVFDIEMMEKVAYGDETKFKVIDGYTALERYYGLVKQRGIVTGTYGTRLTDADLSVAENHLVIDGKTFYYDNTAGLLGKAIVFYSERDRATGGTKQQIEFLYEDPERNRSFQINGEDVVGFEGHDFKYYVGSDERQVRMTDAPDVIANGVAFPEYTPADLKPACGTVTLLDNNGDKIYDVVLIEEYTFMVLDSINPEDGILYGRYPNITIGSKDQEELYRVTMESGITGELGFLLPGDVVAVQSSKNKTGTKLITVTYLGEGTAGVLEGIYKDIYTIDGVQYQVTGATAMDQDAYLLGQNLTLYTFQGHCAALLHPENDNYKFGYLIDAKVNETAFSGTLAVRIVTQDRELLELTAADKFMLDESEYKDAKLAMTQIETAAEKRVLSSDLQAASEAASNSTISRTDLKTLYDSGVIADLVDGEAEFPYSQPVRYRLNNEGELTHLDTIHKGVNETELSLTPFQANGGSELAEIDGAMYSGNDRGFYTYDGNGTLFATLHNAGAVIRPPYNQRDKVEYYGTGSITNEEYCIAEVYSVNDYRVARYAVVYNQIHTAVFEENLVYIVGDIERSLNEEGEVVRQVTLYGYGGPYTRVLGENVDDSQLAIGDVVRYQVNTNNEITVIENYYSIAQGDPVFAQRVKESGQTRAWGSRNRMSYGTVLAYADNVITHTNSVGNSVYKKEGVRNYRVGGTSFYRYTEEGGDPKVEMASAMDMVPYDTDRNTGQRVIMITYSNRLDVVYIIDKD